MNLKEIKEYHSNCIMCGAELEIHSFTSRNVRPIWTDDGLYIDTRIKGKKTIALFKFDGTYSNMENFLKPMSLVKECPNCVPETLMKDRSFGFTTLMQLKDKRFAYSFNLYGDAQNNFAVNMLWEDMKVMRGEEFYHINTDWSTNNSQIIKGNFKTDTLQTMMKAFNLPAINTARLQTIEQFVAKINLYNLFS